MDLNDDSVRAAWRERLSAPFRDRKVVTGLVPLAACAGWLSLLREAGAQRPLVLATGTGVGATATEDEAEVVMLERSAFGTMTEELRDHDRLARDLPAHARAALDAYDPEGEAVWLVGPFVVNEPVLGRRVYGGRPASWLALEDKLAAEEIWRHLDVPHADSAVVPATVAAVTAARSTLDTGAGVVLAADARDGFNGGGEYTRWVVTDEDLAAALEFLGPRCDRVRVMPFLDGVPCSIHGTVLPDGTAAYRPVELAIMRGPARRFVYGGQGTCWDPPEEDRAAMRELVKRTGEHLRDRVGYRGSFGIDGVLTADGFRPTEVNTRMSGGLTGLARAVDHALFVLLELTLLAGEDAGVTVAELEDWAVPAMDGNRFAKAVGMSARRVVEESVTIPVLWDGCALRRAEDADASDAALLVGPSVAGTFFRVDGDLLCAGQRLAPLNAAAVRLLDAELGTGFGEVEIAPDLRRQAT